VLALAAFGLILSLHGTQDAVANGDTRTLDLYHTHTKESLRITFRRDGAFDNAALEKLNWFLRDWRMDEPTTMAPELFDIVWYSAREAGATEPIRIVSAYRSPGTNAMLARRSRAVAKNSQHMRGNAMDFHVPGIPMSKVREIAMRLQRGGVGYYPNAGTPFVHLDVGSVRSWPRMPRDQLERLFPDGKTVHIPADGVPLANYEAALAEVQARGGSALDYATVNANRGKSLWALLFGSGDEDEDSESSRPSLRNAAANRTRVASAAMPVEAPVTGEGNPMRVTAYAPEPAAIPAPRMAAAAPLAAPNPASSAATQPVAAQPVAILAPIPPPRPRGSALQAMLASLAPQQGTPQTLALNVPLPPARPASLKMASAPEKGDAQPALVASAPLPPLRTLVQTPPPVIASAPIRPAAPVEAKPVPISAEDRAVLAAAALRAAQQGDLSITSGRLSLSTSSNTSHGAGRAPTAFLNQVVFPVQ
jgi:uncharacterized protein YcbK (DUF882 family)